MKKFNFLFILTLFITLFSTTCFASDDIYNSTLLVEYISSEVNEDISSFEGVDSLINYFNGSTNKEFWFLHDGVPSQLICNSTFNGTYNFDKTSSSINYYYLDLKPGTFTEKDGNFKIDFGYLYLIDKANNKIIALQRFPDLIFRPANYPEFSDFLSQSTINSLVQDITISSKDYSLGTSLSGFSAITPTASTPVEPPVEDLPENVPSVSYPIPPAMDYAFTYPVVYVAENGDVSLALFGSDTSINFDAIREENKITVNFTTSSASKLSMYVLEDDEWDSRGHNVFSEAGTYTATLNMTSLLSSPFAIYNSDGTIFFLLPLESMGATITGAMWATTIVAVCCLALLIFLVVLSKALHRFLP